MANLINEIITFWLTTFSGLNVIPWEFTSADSIWSFFGISFSSLMLGDVVGYLFVIITVISLVVVPICLIVMVVKLTMRAIGVLKWK